MIEALIVMGALLLPCLLLWPLIFSDKRDNIYIAMYRERDDDDD